jgi:non-specific serine/threonine protein kinase
MKEYAIEKRNAIPPHLQHRHLAYYSHVAKLAQIAGLDADNYKWLHALDADYSNITAALNRACDSASDNVDGLALAVALYRYWYRKGYRRQAANWYQRTMDVAIDAPTDLRAEAFNCLGIFSYYDNKRDAAQIAYEQSFSLYKELGNYTKMGSTLNNLAMLALQESNEERAKELMREASVAFEKAGDDDRLASVLGNIGMLENSQGNLLHATEILERAVKIRRRVDEKEALGVQATNLLGLYAEGNTLEQHLDLLEECIELAHDVESPFLCAMTLDVVAFLADRLDKREFAARMIGAAIGAEAQLEAQAVGVENQFRAKLIQSLQEKLGRQSYRKENKAGESLRSQKALEEARDFVQGL